MHGIQQKQCGLCRGTTKTRDFTKCVGIEDQLRSQKVMKYLRFQAASTIPCILHPPTSVCLQNISMDAFIVSSFSFFHLKLLTRKKDLPDLNPEKLKQSTCQTELPPTHAQMHRYVVLHRTCSCIMTKKGRSESVSIAQEALMPPSLIDTQIKVTKQTDGNCQKQTLLESLDGRTVY